MKMKSPHTIAAATTLLFILPARASSFHCAKGAFGPVTTRSMAQESTPENGDADNDDVVPPLRYLGDAQLMQRQPPVTKEQIQSKEFRNNIAMLTQAMKKYGGIGIAAPQVGWWTRVFCFGINGTNPRYPNADELPFTTWVNPKIIWSSDETNWMWEGCLSVPGMRGWVERPSEIKLTGWDEHGNERDEAQHLVGLAARIVQHELDHLDGILFPQCVPDQTFLVPQASIDGREGWATDWPSRGSYKTSLGDLSNEK